ncbi:MAG: PASTA domain-containing protein [Deltaproteobacteria bacterium]|nr:MAG: PASTA domain-containing protein [Deltaproteobacteria bacterium]
MRQGPSLASVILTSIITSVITAVLTVILMQRLGPIGTGDIIVPDLTGLNQADARANLESKGLVFLVGGRKPSPTAAPGTVLSQSPPAGSRVKAGSTVSVTLAGEAPRVPDLKGRTVAEATVLLEQAGFKISVGPEVASDEVAAGRVVKQEPAAGLAYEPGRTIVVNLSSGPAKKEVPKVTGMGLGRARRILQDAGFKVGKVTYRYDEDWGPYVVLGQTPRAGEKAKPGSAIDLVVNED